MAYNLSRAAATMMRVVRADTIRSAWQWCARIIHVCGDVQVQARRLPLHFFFRLYPMNHADDTSAGYARVAVAAMMSR